MKNITKLCCFSVNITHSCIIVNNFISNELPDANVIYINEKNESKKLKAIMSRFYPSLEGRLNYTKWPSEYVLNNYIDEKYVFVITGSENFIRNVNRFLSLSDYNCYIINCYDIFEVSSKMHDIILKHDYYLNTEGIAIKEKI